MPSKLAKIISFFLLLLSQIKGSVCLGILNGTEIGLQNYNIIGGEQL